MCFDIFNQTQKIQHTLQCYANGDLSYKGNFVLVSYGRFECGHPVVFILKHLITYNSVNTTQNVNMFIATCFDSLESSSGYD
jgi:hypothetical protein